MTKLEKSIRHELNIYGAGLRNGHWGAVGHTTGDLPRNGFLESANYSCDPEQGIVTDIRLYAVGDGMEMDDFNGLNSITEPVERFIKGETDWDGLVSEISEIASREIEWRKMLPKIADTVKPLVAGLAANAADPDDDAAGVTVINNSGAQIDYKAAERMMDDEIREALHGEMAPCSEQEFFTAYELLHETRYGEPWELSTDNPCW